MSGIVTVQWNSFFRILYQVVAIFGFESLKNAECNKYFYRLQCTTFSLAPFSPSPIVSAARYLGKISTPDDVQDKSFRFSVQHQQR